MNLLILGMVNSTVHTAGLSNWVGNLVGQSPVEIKYFYNELKYNILDCLNWCDIMVFPAFRIGTAEFELLLSSLERTEREITVVFDGLEAKDWFDQNLSDEQAYNLKQHRFFQLGPNQQRISLAAKVLAWTIRKKS
jgi:hypothetical protein